jgi:RNA polymerase sigma factor (sigma-70 family)
MPEPTTLRQRTDLTQLTRAAAGGDEHAWTDLVTRLDAALRAVAGRYRLGADVDDVVQTAWLRALDHVDRINDPGAIAGWLVTTTRREAMRTLQRGVREVVDGDVAAVEEADAATPETVAIERERRAAVHEAVARLPRRQRRLMATLLTLPAPSYERVARRTGMPVGSIGPTRDRAIARLREDRRLVAQLAVTP